MSIEDVYSKQVAGKVCISSLPSSSYHSSEIIKDPQFKQISTNTLQSLLSVVQKHETSNEPPPTTVVSFEQAIRELCQQKYN